MEYDHDSEFEFDEGDDKSLKTPEKTADDNDSRAGEWEILWWRSVMVT